MTGELSDPEDCTFCDQNLADFGEDLHDYKTLFHYLDQLQEGEQRVDGAPIPEIPGVGAWTGVCHCCENYRISSEFFRLAINPLLRTLIKCFSADELSSLPELKKGLQLIGETPHINMRSKDGHLHQLLYQTASDRTGCIARILLNDLGHSTQATPKALEIEPERDQSKPAHGTLLLADIAWNIRDPVEKADSENEMDLNTMLFPSTVTLLLSNRECTNEWEIRVRDTSVRGILQSIRDSYEKYEADHEEDDPMGDDCLFEGLAYDEADELWMVKLGA